MTDFLFYQVLWRMHGSELLLLRKYGGEIVSPLELHRFRESLRSKPAARSQN